MNFWLCRKGVDMSKYLIENLFGIEGWSIAWYGDILTIFKIWKGGLAIYGGVIGGLGRFLIEGLRTDSIYIISGIRVSQVLSLFLICGGILLYVFFVRRDKTKNVYSGRYIR
jgi:prolipoprotein diacylglyceryltransferase